MIEVRSFKYLRRCLFLNICYLLGIIAGDMEFYLLMLRFILGIHSLENKEIINQSFRNLYIGLFIDLKTVIDKLFINLYSN
jgi:hypothetical protein